MSSPAASDQQQRSALHDPSDPWWRRARRRCLTVPAVSLGLALATALFPPLLVLAIVVDRLRRPAMAVRLLCVGWAYLAGEVIGVLWLAVLWLGALPWPPAARARRLDAGAAALQRCWTVTLLRGAAALFRLRFVVELEQDEASLLAGPAVVLIRHCSLLDTLLPSTFLTARHGLRLRFVLKRELLLDPCLDIAGHLLPNCFVRRDGADSTSEIARIRALAAGIDAREWGLIYPEGTRFTEEKRRRVRARLQADPDPRLASVLPAALAMERVLPPQIGGALALLDGAPVADAVFFAHHGLEAAGRGADLWRGGLLDQRVTLRLWRVPRSQIPPTGAARVEWLYSQWQRVDAWLAEQAARGDDRDPGAPSGLSRARFVRVAAPGAKPGVRKELAAC